MIFITTTVSLPSVLICLWWKEVTCFRYNTVINVLDLKVNGQKVPFGSQYSGGIFCSNHSQELNFRVHYSIDFVVHWSRCPLSKNKQNCKSPKYPFIRFAAIDHNKSAPLVSVFPTRIEDLIAYTTIHFIFERQCVAVCIHASLAYRFNMDSYIWCTIHKWYHIFMERKDLYSLHCVVSNVSFHVVM